MKTRQDDDETRQAQISRLKEELAVLKLPLDMQRLSEILAEMDELREYLEATERALRLPPEPESFSH